MKDNIWKKYSDDDIVITASPEFLVAEGCRRLNIPTCLGTPVVKEKGYIDGLNCHDTEKVRRFVEAGFDPDSIDEFYSDSYSDQPLRDIARKGYLVKGEKLVDWQ